MFLIRFADCTMTLDMNQIDVSVPIDYSIYNDALRQLHQNNLALQEITQNLLKDQHSMATTMSRILLDLEAHKESYNCRIAEMMTSVDGDIKKVSHDCLVQNAKSITQLKDVFVENKELTHLKEQVALLKNMVHDMKMFTLDKDGKRIANGSSSESKIDKLGKEFSTFKATVDLKLADVASNHSNIVHSCMRQIEDYIGTVLLEEIVSMINLKLHNVKAEYELECERVKIKLDDLSIRYTELKHKVADMEMPMRTFDESALYSYGVDEVVTPIRLSVLNL